MSKKTNIAIVTAIRRQGMTVAEAARTFKRSRQWIYTLLARYDAGGIDAVTPQPRTPRSQPHTTPESTIKQIIAIRRELSSKGADNGPDTISWVLEQRGIHPPAESTIRRILTTHGMITPQPKKRPKATLRRFEAALPNETWQADVTFVRLANNKTISILDFLDDHSRYLLYLEAHYHVYGPTVVRAMEAITAEYGLPQSTLTDNGTVFTTRLTGPTAGRNGFEQFLADHSIKLRRPGLVGD